MSFEPALRPGDVLSNDELCEMFECSPQGGMRRSHRTNSLVLISNYVEDAVYEDRWVGSILHYTGMGQKGDQSVEFMQNKTLAQSPENGVQMFLFEVHHPREYTYFGEVRLAGEPYQEKQPDVDGDIRSVWMFPLEIVNAGRSTAPPKEVFDHIFQKKERAAGELSAEQLRERAARVRPEIGKRDVAVTQYDRSHWVSQYAKRRASGRCELCGEPAPFLDKDGIPYLETHHIVWLARGGEDSIENTVALCPNCHRKMHVLDQPADRNVLDVVTRNHSLDLEQR